MKRILFQSLVFLLLLCTTVLVAQEEDTEKKSEIEQAWENLLLGEPVSTDAILFFASRPEEGTEFLKGKLKQLRLSKELFEELLEQLASEDEKVAEEAYDEFRYLDPRIHLELTELMEFVDDHPAKTRIVEVLSGHGFDSMAGKEVSLRSFDGDEGNKNYNFVCGGTSFWAEADLSRYNQADNSWLSKPDWTRAMRAIKLLEHYDTPASKKLIAKMAMGHIDCAPTKLAREIAMADKLENKKE